MSLGIRKIKISSDGYKVNLRVEKDNFEWSLYVHLEPKQKKMLKSLGVVYKN